MWDLVALSPFDGAPNVAARVCRPPQGPCGRGAARRLRPALPRVNLIPSGSRAGRNAKHQQRWGNTFRDLVYPIIGDVPVSDITTDLVLNLLKPIS